MKQNPQLPKGNGQSPTNKSTIGATLGTQALKSLVNPAQPGKKKGLISNLATPVLGNAAKSDLAQKLLGAADDLAPLAASFIPGIGPILSHMMTTMNDDEWFEMYKSTGASFNELLVTRLVKSDTQSNTTIIPRAAFAFVTSQVNDVAAFTELFMPSVLAHIRITTNNVLVDDTDKYKDGFIAMMKLYALYYSLEKYILFAQKQPINIPLIAGKVTIIKPESLNQLVGIRDGVRSYLQASVRLPYALVQAIRWRFGTAYHSFNTGQPGIIFYDPVPNFETQTMAQLQTLVTTYQTTIMSAGRASADIKMAYNDHTIQYDVEAAHYDEKEFNLRLNLSNGAAQTVYRQDLIELIKDSRLDLSPAIQASCLSTREVSATGVSMGSTTELFYISDIRFSTYVFNESMEATSIAAGSAVRMALDSITNSGVPQSGAFANAWVTLSAFPLANSDVYGQMFTGLAWAAGSASSTATPGTLSAGTGTNGTNLAPVLGLALANSLGFEHLSAKLPIRMGSIASGVVTPAGTLIVSMDRISYDYARINNSTLRSIQTAAIRNLTRGDYKQKSNTSQDADKAVEVAKDIIKTAAPKDTEVVVL